MRVIVVSAFRLFRESLAVNLEQDEIDVKTVETLSDLITRLSNADIDLALIDVTQDLDLEELRLLAAEWSNVRLIALGLREQREEVIRHGRAGFAGYVARDVSIKELRQVMDDAMAGRLRCPAEIANGIFRALFRPAEILAVVRTAPQDVHLTARESEVLRFLGRGLSNKEIARELNLSIATVKHHVHNVLAKLGLVSRAQAMRRVRAAPWVATPG
jgi:DNA-binding NarL/FixJ family response regulator